MVSQDRPLREQQLLRAWDVDTRTWRGDYRNYTGYAIAFLPKGNKLWIPNHGLVEWDPTIPTAKLVPGPDLPKLGNAANDICYASSGKHCVVWEGTSISIWDLSAQPAVLLKRIDGVRRTRPASTPDGNRLAYVSETEKAVIVCEITPTSVVERLSLIHI